MSTSSAAYSNSSLATLIGMLAVSGGSHVSIGHVSIDGHVTDPHLQPVLERIPHKDAQPVDLAAHAAPRHGGETCTN
jgi:hypothetical protein